MISGGLLKPPDFTKLYKMKFIYPSSNLVRFFCLILLCLNSCSDTDGKILLDQTTSFSIPENSRPIKTIQADVDFYQNLTIQKSLNNLVLYKLIRGQNYQLYVGVALSVTLNEMRQQLISNPKLKLIDQKSPSSVSESIFLQIDSVRFCYHYLKQLKQGDKYLFSVTTTNRELVENMYNSDFLEKYFVNE